MWTKILNGLGIQTRAQREAEQNRLLEAIRQITAERTGNTYEMPVIKDVITSDDVPTRRPSRTKSKVPASQGAISPPRRDSSTDWDVITTSLVGGSLYAASDYVSNSNSSSFSDCSPGSGSSFDSGSSSSFSDGGSSSSGGFDC